MKYQLPLLLVGCSSLLLASCATKTSTDKNAPTGPASATVTLEASGAAYWASTGTGQGTLSYRGKKHGFTVTAVGGGGTGAQKISATGKVYNLDSLSDFPGTYTIVRSGFTVYKGTLHAKLSKDDDVTIYLTADTTGLASSTGAGKVIIKMKN